MDISHAEYKLLKKLNKAKKLVVDNETSDLLLSKGLVESEVTGFINGIVQYSDKIELTNSGKIAFEQYQYSHKTARGSSLRSWIAIVISCLALIVSAVNVYMSHFNS